MSCATEPTRRLRDTRHAENRSMNATALSVDGFKSILRQQVERICDEQGWRYNNEAERGWAFQRWCGELLSNREGLDASVDDGMFLTNDIKIDVALEDADRRVLYLVQSKFMSIAQSPPLIEDEIVSFFNRHQLLLTDPAWVQRHGSDQILEYIGDYKDRLDGGGAIYFILP